MSRRRIASTWRDIVAQCRPVDDGRLAHVTRLNALLTSYLFLLWFDTRSGYQDTGPYRLDDGRVLLLRAFNGLGPSHFPWSADVASEMPNSDVLAAFVLDGVDFHVTDFGTSVTDPEDYLSHVVELRSCSTSASGAPVADRRRRHRRARRRGQGRATQALPHDRGHGTPGQDRRRRVRVLHVPAAVRRARRRRPRLDRAARQHSTSIRCSSSSTARLPGGVTEETVDTYYSVIP